MKLTTTSSLTALALGVSLALAAPATVEAQAAAPAQATQTQGAQPQAAQSQSQGTQAAPAQGFRNAGAQDAQAQQSRDQGSGASSNATQDGQFQQAQGAPAQGVQQPWNSVHAMGAQARSASTAQAAAAPSEINRRGTSTATTGMSADDSASVAAGNRATARADNRQYDDGGTGAGVDTTLNPDVDGRPDTPAQVGLGGTLGDFASHDANNDGFVERSELQGDNRLAADDFNRFDLDDNGRLDRYEYDSLSAGAFTTLDANRDNAIDLQETSGFAALNSNFASADRNGDGRISRAEHNAFLDGATWSTPRDRYAFAYLDVDGDGFISRTEAQAFAGASAEFDALDNDADGLIDQQAYDSFLNDWDEEDYAAGDQ